MTGFRFLTIARVAWRHSLLQFIPGNSWPARLARWLSPHAGSARAVQLRLALETLGPIFVKFGQLLSTRRDLLPTDIADELAKLQDQVPPFSGVAAVAAIERSFGRRLEHVFQDFDITPVASASVAQVHFARLPDGREVAVKILRPGIGEVIEHDIQLLEAAAWFVEKLFADGPRLRPREVVAEFARHLRDELDLQLEAANCSQLRRNFSDARQLLVPEVHFDWCTSEVMTMQRMHGLPISQIEALRAAGIDLRRLSRYGVEIFFTQVFRDGFFHADMHPGNILVAPDGRYIALDFGIVGTLSDSDQHYLAVNFLAFFNRDYRRVAEAHLESGWVPPGTRVAEFEAAIRAVCEPIFDKPLAQISFGKVLLRLFQTSRRFGMEIQPQLVLLQKTLINIEGLGRQLDPELDLWVTAKPYLERWMRERLGLKATLKHLVNDWPNWTRLLQGLPGRLHSGATDTRTVVFTAYARLLRVQQRQSMALWLMAVLLLVLVIKSCVG